MAPSCRTVELSGHGSARRRATTGRAVIDQEGRDNSDRDARDEDGEDQTVDGPKGTTRIVRQSTARDQQRNSTGSCGHDS